MVRVADDIILKLHIYICDGIILKGIFLKVHRIDRSILYCLIFDVEGFVERIWRNIRFFDRKYFREEYIRIIFDKGYVEFLRKRKSEPDWYLVARSANNFTMDL